MLVLIILMRISATSLNPKRRMSNFFWVFVLRLA